MNYLAVGGISLEGTDMVGDKKAYKVKITDNKTAFYDAETGLKLQEVNVLEMQGQTMQQTMILG
ncbi:hypothetical protein [Maribacter litopenaei]|uniref:hypothetical protein n=1 Tax=Maribacter litopenaei TaxID=2976127 RepID=UPI003083F42E